MDPTKEPDCCNTCSCNFWDDNCSSDVRMRKLYPTGEKTYEAIPGDPMEFVCLFHTPAPVYTEAPGFSNQFKRVPSSGHKCELSDSGSPSDKDVDHKALDKETRGGDAEGDAV